MPIDENTGGWSRSEMHVNAELVRLSNAIVDLTETVGAMKIEVATLKTKASIWGGLIGAAVGIATKYLLG